MEDQAAGQQRARTLVARYSAVAEESLFLFHGSRPPAGDLKESFHRPA